MDVSIIIVNYNTCKLTLECLKSVYQKTDGLSFEIIVVDNASSDNSVLKIQNAFPEVILIKSTENLGFGKANNLGYKLSKANHILLLNPDTVLINNAIKILSDFLNNMKSISIVGGQLYKADGITKTHSYSYFFPSIIMELDILFNGLITRIYDHFKIKCNQTYFEVAYITGADMMLRRSDLNEIGFFDERFFLYYEETELSHRFKLKGKLSAFVSKAKIIHLEGESFPITKYRNKKFLEGRNTYYLITSSKFYKFICDIIWYSNGILIFISNKFSYLKAYFNKIIFSKKH